MRKMKAIIQKTEDGYIDPVGLKGIVVADGDTYEEVNNLKEAIAFHIETSGSEVTEA